MPTVTTDRSFSPVPGHPLPPSSPFRYESGESDNPAHGRALGTLRRAAGHLAAHGIHDAYDSESIHTLMCLSREIFREYAELRSGWGGGEAFESHC